ncbi:uncharacterized protein LOC108210212 [Daucus carota subsp. sativus]|uniref:uncharacterized protein LOC108210212 n=1 Tax=Daucus carota subsp. sativus TaxID=79200 RepID=UPI0007B267AE|nr:PREDICTED: paramyosin [Daucus carota subsp. sativus]
MASHHASLGRRTLEEIRQKRAAERLIKVSSGPDLTKPPLPDDVGIKRSESGGRLNENDVTSLLSQLKDMQHKNSELADENKILVLKLQAKEGENETLKQNLHELEKTVPSLRKALKDVAMGKDAAVVAKEDLSAQLRAMKKRLKEAEEEQYRAEEDAAALRAELNMLQQQAISGSLGSVSSMANSHDQLQALETEVTNLKSQLEQVSLLRQQEQQRFSEVQSQVTTLAYEKQVLEEKYAAVSISDSEKVTEKGTETAPEKTFSLEDKQRLEQQLHDMAVAIERFESSRQKLLLEIDSQSSEIEKLFEENSNLSSAYQEAMTVVAHWESQVSDCLKQNEELRAMLDKLRMEQANITTSTLNENSNQRHLLDSNKDLGDETTPQAIPAEVISLKGQLAKEQSKAEALSAEVMQLSSRLQQATQAYNGLARLYKPVLRNIETGLLKMKQDSSLMVQ